MSEFITPDDESLPIILADSFDVDALHQMCAQTTAVVSTVGPFVNYGTPLVEACIAEGTNYCDSTGETTWIKRLIDTLEDKAKANGVRLVPSCGYDSLPSDIGALVTVNGIKADKGNDAKIGKVTHYIGPMNGDASGGTLHTMMNLFENEEKSQLIKTMGNPYALCPEGTKGKDTGDRKWFSSDKVSGGYMAPWVMSSANERVVRRSWYQNAYGTSFQYEEVLLLSSFIKGLLVSIGISLTVALVLIPPVRWLITKYVLPDAGTGPSRKARDKGYAISYMHSKSGGDNYLTTIKISNGDVGYKSTSMMLGECVIALARSESQEGGFFTPASCPGLGLDIRDTLAEKCSITFDFEKVKSSNELKTKIVAYDMKVARL